MSDEDRLRNGWKELVDGLTKVGETIEARLSGRSEVERADAYRAALRVLGANLGKLEADGRHPLPVHVNPPNQKWFLDNPDGMTVHCPIDPGHRYRVYGRLGDAKYTSFTTYEGKGDQLATRATATRTDRDLVVHPGGAFEFELSSDERDDPSHLCLRPGTGQLWIRQLFDDIHRDEPGWFRIENLGPVEPPAAADPAAVAGATKRLARAMPMLTQVMLGAFKLQLSRHPENAIRVWDEMAGGAVFTNEDVRYAIGRWHLKAGESLVLRGVLPRCRHWNLVLYSTVLNSLEHRYRSTSITGSRLKTANDGSYGIHVSAERPPDAVDWLDTEGREEGVFVLRITGAEETTELPEVSVDRSRGPS